MKFEGEEEGVRKKKKKRKKIKEKKSKRENGRRQDVGSRQVSPAGCCWLLDKERLWGAGIKRCGRGRMLLAGGRLRFAL